MLRLLFVLLALPFWVYFPIAAGVGFMAEAVCKAELKNQSDRVQALSHGPPALVNLSDFRRATDIGLVKEVHAAAQIGSSEVDAQTSYKRFFL